MTETHNDELARLQHLYEQGALSEALYHAALRGLGLDSDAPPATYDAEISGGSTTAQGAQARAASEGGIATDNLGGSAVTGDDSIAAGGHVIIAGDGARVVVGEEPVATPAVNGASTLAHYLRHLISRNRYLRLQGIRSGGKLVSIELDRIYITLRATRQREVRDEEAWLAAEAELAPGEARMRRIEEARTHTETVTVSVNEALAAHKRLVVLGDPGSGKTTLLRYLTLCYARDLAEGADAAQPDRQDSLVQARLGLEEGGFLPILLPLRRLGAYLRAHYPDDDGTEGHGVLLDHVREMLAGERVEVSAEFFDSYLESGRAVVLLDGLDEVADPAMRRRVARLVEAFTAAYPACRYVVSSRIVGYAGAARLSEGDYRTTTVRAFTMEDVAQFLHNWHLAVAVGLMGPGASAAAYAEAQTQRLLAAIEANERIRDLAINPLMLTVIALVHRDRVKLPDRRAELYDEAVDVLLGKWDEARGVQDVRVLEDAAFDAKDRRLVLEAVALWMHERQQKEIEMADLRRLLGEHFYAIVGDWRAVERVIDRFLRVIRERTGLLAEHGVGVYRFSHLTFQEYLAALAVAGRDDYVDYTLQKASADWWREAILLEAGYLSTQSRTKTTRLIRAIAEAEEEPVPYHNLVLAAECLRDVGARRVEGDLETEIQRRLRAELETSPPEGWLSKIQLRLQRGMSADELTQRRIAAAQALARIGGTQYWQPPDGEPEWVEVPAGEFWMGTREEEIPRLMEQFGGERGWYEDEAPRHRVFLPAYAIARVPITNVQYQFFVKATGHVPPSHWEEQRPPKGKESHPVVNVSWHDAMAYCAWLSEVTGKVITLPSEAQWEKAASWDAEQEKQRVFPWGDVWDPLKCNSFELRLGDTTSVGIFTEGVSPYGCLDMAGNVWEWTRSLWGEDVSESVFKYPYDVRDGREDVGAGDEVRRVVRGGSFGDDRYYVRCSCRLRLSGAVGGYGFRVCVSPSRSAL